MAAKFDVVALTASAGGLHALSHVLMGLPASLEEFAKAGNTAAAARCFDKARAAHERVAPMREAAIETKS